MIGVALVIGIGVVCIPLLMLTAIGLLRELLDKDAPALEERLASKCLSPNPSFAEVRRACGLPVGEHGNDEFAAWPVETFVSPSHTVIRRRDV
ncbi:MAG TPA: hypothetical protein VM493_07860 [Vicinamibacterales bacterium]|nr:hypothetical protein [Vicinamibacterales bacterium]